MTSRSIGQDFLKTKKRFDLVHTPLHLRHPCLDEEYLAGFFEGFWCNRNKALWKAHQFLISLNTFKIPLWAASWCNKNGEALLIAYVVRPAASVSNRQSVLLTSWCRCKCSHWFYKFFSGSNPISQTGLPWKPYGCSFKCWYPTTMGFPTKNDHFEVFWGYNHLRKHPYHKGLVLEKSGQVWGLPPPHQGTWISAMFGSPRWLSWKLPAKSEFPKRDLSQQLSTDSKISNHFLKKNDTLYKNKKKPPAFDI